MSADPNTNKETRIILDIGDQRLVFFAQELFVTGGNNLFATVSKDDGEDFKSRILMNKDSLLSVLTTPARFDSTKNAILINSLMVRTQDNSVFQISAYINPAAFKARREFQALSEKVFSSLSKGTRRMNFKARTETLPIFDGRKSFVIKIPEGYVVTKDKKYDFEVLKLQRVKDISDTSWQSLTIYAGNHPSYFYGEYEFNEDAANKVKGHFLDKDVEWLSFKNEAKHFYLKEQKIPSDDIEPGLVVHIAMLGNNPKAIEELTRLIEDIKVAGK